MDGVSGGRFAPAEAMTRGEIVSVLWRLEGRPEAPASAFVDVRDTDCSGAVAWAAANGVVSGYSQSTFGPSDPVTREQLAVMLYRYAQYKGYDTTQDGMAVREFSDYDQISGYAGEAMTWAVDAGVCSGVTPDTLAPTQAATRGQIAQALLQLSGLEA